MCHFLLKKQQGESHEVASQQVFMGAIFFFFLSCVTLTVLENVIRYKITLGTGWWDEKKKIPVFNLFHTWLLSTRAYQTFVKFTSSDVPIKCLRLVMWFCMTPAEIKAGLWAAYFYCSVKNFNRKGTCGAKHNTVKAHREALPPHSFRLPSFIRNLGYCI